MDRLPYYAGTGIIVLSAYAVDLMTGDPRWIPHPVRGIGWMIQRLEGILRRSATSPLAEKKAGIILVILVVSLVTIISQSVISLVSNLSVYAGLIVSILIASTTLASRGLGDSANSVLRRLEEGDLGLARSELSMIVGRDTANLDEQEISRAVVETVAENASDGVIAPLFYLALGGPALALAYKAMNTLDSMVGYKNARYVNFGWAAARLDDVANYIPARITAVMICLVSDLFRVGESTRACIGRIFATTSALRIPDSELQSPWRIMLRDGRNHPSPNSGYPEAAMAGALGIRLGGPSTYAGKLSLKPGLGEALSPIEKKHIEKSVLLMYCATSLAALWAAGILFLL